MAAEPLPYRPLAGDGIALREAQPRDLDPLRSFLTGDVVRFTAPPPSSDAALLAFLDSLPERRRRGRLLCLCLTLPPSDQPVGIFQLWPSEGSVWGWGFALARERWGQGLFTRSTALLIPFAKNDLGATALEGWCCVDNVRGNRALARFAGQSRAVFDATDPGGLRGDFLVWTIDLATVAVPAGIKTQRL